MAKIISIHQPNFFPWLGYFDKIIKSDYFIFLDDVQFPKKGGNWVNRVKLLIQGEERWITAKVDRSYHGTRDINEIKVVDNQIWQKKIIKTLSQNYSKHEFFTEIMMFIENLLVNDEKYLSKYNSNNIISILKKLELDSSKCFFSSDINLINFKSNERLIHLVKSLKGDTYLCGGGSMNYQNDELFFENNLNIKYQKYAHPKYTQNGSGEFISGLSIIDCLMNLGFERTSSLLLENSRL